MTMLLCAMLSLTFLGALAKNRGVETENKPEETVVPQQESKKVPSTFKGTVHDDFNVPDGVMKVIVSYMDKYYKSLYTLEKEDLSSLFDNELAAAVSDRALSLVVDVRKGFDFDFTMSDARYDLTVTDYRAEGDVYYVDLLEDDHMWFSFLEGIESSTYDVENYFRIVKKGKDYLISDLEKVQGYYMTFRDGADTVKEADGIYDYYMAQLRDMNDYFDEVLKPKAKRDPFLSDKTFAHAYDRDKAVAYADAHHHERNPVWYNFSDEGGNCQNYASQCLLEGGIGMDYQGEEQWKCYIEDPEYDPEINEEDGKSGRSRSWVNVGYFYDYAKYNEDGGLCAEVNANLYYAQPGDIIMVGNGGLSHTVIVSRVIGDHILVDSNSIDMKDYPLEAYVYTNITLIKILGSN